VSRQHPWQTRFVDGREHVFPIDAKVALRSKPEVGTEIRAPVKGCVLCDVGLCRQVVMQRVPESVVHGPRVQP
jgi:hypothetical protein